MLQDSLAIKTERLELIPLKLSQLERMLKGQDSLEQVLGFDVTPGLLTEPVIKALEIKINQMSIQDECLHTWFTFWLMVLPGDGKIIGMLGFKGVPGVDGQVEIGYGICHEYESKGYTTEAVRTLIAWAFSQPGCTAIMAQTLKDNFASMRVLQKAGMLRTDENENLITWSLNQ